MAIQVGTILVGKEESIHGDSVYEVEFYKVLGIKARTIKVIPLMNKKINGEVSPSENEYPNTGTARQVRSKITGDLYYQIKLAGCKYSGYFQVYDGQPIKVTSRNYK